MLEINIKTASEIKDRYYFAPIKEVFEVKAEETGYKNALNYLTEVMQRATSKVEELIKARVRDKIISRADQARKAIAGNGFQGVGFITTNFYEEITNPQQKGMLNFFDFVYITKPGKWEKPIREFSRIVDDLNAVYK